MFELITVRYAGGPEDRGGKNGLFPQATVDLRIEAVRAVFPIRLPSACIMSVVPRIEGKRLSCRHMWVVRRLLQSAVGEGILFAYPFS